MNITEKIKTGMTNTVYSLVSDKNTAEAFKSGTLPVYATPAMAALMEQASAELAEVLLPDEWTSVGISMNIAHLSASPVNIKISATATVTAIDDRKITYAITASDESGLIGKGTHERFVVNKTKFLQKAAHKLAEK